VEQGPVEQTILEQSMRQGMPLPQRIAEAPSLQIGLQLFWDAYMELSTCRMAAMSVGPIPWTAIMDYAKAWELDPYQTEDLMDIVRAMDNAYLTWEAKRTKRDQKMTSKPGKGDRSGR